MDSTGMTAGEVHELGPNERHLTALLRARFWKWWGEAMFDDGGGRR